MAESETDAASQRSVAQPIGADGVGGFVRLGRSRVVDQKIDNSGAEQGGCVRGNNIARPRGAAALCDDVEQSPGRFGAVARRDRAKLCRAYPIAADADA